MVEKIIKFVIILIFAAWVFSLWKSRPLCWVNLCLPIP